MESSEVLSELSAAFDMEASLGPFYGLISNWNFICHVLDNNLFSLKYFLGYY